MAKKSRTREARERRQKQQRQNQRRLLLAVIAIVAVVAAAVVVVANQAVDVYVPDDMQERYEGMSRSFSIDGYPQLGELDAPVTVEEYASFACPACEVLHSESFDAILERVRSGQVLFSYVPMQTGSIPNASGAARAALCAGQQDMFWEMHDVLFDWQTRYANTAFSQNHLLAGVDALGLNSASFSACFDSPAISETLAAAVNENVSATPTINVNGVTIAAQQAGSIPSTATILKAIDDATPNDWGVASEIESDESDTESAVSPEDIAEDDEEVAAAVELESEADEPTPVADETGDADEAEATESPTEPDKSDDRDAPAVSEATAAEAAEAGDASENGDQASEATESAEG